jgi:tetratricopeptide (TPR) repeat protein
MYLLSQKWSRVQLPWIFTFLAGALFFASPIRSQERRPDWQTEVRKYAEAQDWIAAMRIVERELARAPQDMDVRAWHARVLTWSGHLAEAEKEYLAILDSSRNDPDNWMGLASVYMREGKARDAFRALDRAVEMDPKRADLLAARARALLAMGEQTRARLDFQRALNLDPASVEARAGLTSIRSARIYWRPERERYWPWVNKPGPAWTSRER